MTIYSPISSFAPEIPRSEPSMANLQISNTSNTALVSLQDLSTEVLDQIFSELQEFDPSKFISLTLVSKIISRVARPFYYHTFTLKPLHFAPTDPVHNQALLKIHTFTKEICISYPLDWELTVEFLTKCTSLQALHHTPSPPWYGTLPHELTHHLITHPHLRVHLHHAHFYDKYHLSTMLPISPFVLSFSSPSSSKKMRYLNIWTKYFLGSCPNLQVLKLRNVLMELNHVSEPLEAGIRELVLEDVRWIENDAEEEEDEGREYGFFSLFNLQSLTHLTIHRTQPFPLLLSLNSPPFLQISLPSLTHFTLTSLPLKVEQEPTLLSYFNDVLPPTLSRCLETTRQLCTFLSGIPPNLRSLEIMVQIDDLDLSCLMRHRELRRLMVRDYAGYTEQYSSSPPTLSGAQLEQIREACPKLTSLEIDINVENTDLLSQTFPLLSLFTSLTHIHLYIPSLLLSHPSDEPILTDLDYEHAVSLKETLITSKSGLHWEEIKIEVHGFEVLGEKGIEKSELNKEIGGWRVDGGFVWGWKWEGREGWKGWEGRW